MPRPSIAALVTPIIGLDWWISVRVTGDGWVIKTHTSKVYGLGNRYLGRLLCRWDEEP